MPLVVGTISLSALPREAASQPVPRRSRNGATGARGPTRRRGAERGAPSTRPRAFARTVGPLGLHLLAQPARLLLGPPALFPVPLWLLLSSLAQRTVDGLGPVGLEGAGADRDDGFEKIPGPYTRNLADYLRSVGTRRGPA
jgi:hypothetical protein